MDLDDPTASVTGGPPSRSAPTWQRRTELDVIAQQLHAIGQFNRARQAREAADAAAAAAVGRTREMRLDAARSLQVVRRQHDALIARSHAQLRATGDLLRDTAKRRVVLAHRSDWYAGAIGRALRDAGVVVVACVDNGADAVGLLVAAQPDLVLVEDQLAMGGADDVLREAHRFAPCTLVGVQAAYTARTGALLRGGAAAVFSRRTPPQDVAVDLLQLIAV